MTTTLKIDFVSDVSCPWCAIGLRSLQTALDQVAPEVSAQVHFQPFELNPQMGPEGQEIVEHLTEKYGISPAQVDSNREAIRARGAAVGFEFGMGKRSRIYNTFDAHRLLHWAHEVAGAEVQQALKMALFKAYFTEGEDPSQRSVLVACAQQVGLDGTQAGAVLDGGAYAEAVREREQFYTQHGIHSVPAIIINDRHLISGGQPPEVFAQALRQLAASS